MSDPLNPGWYNRNENRAYPVDDAATGVDDAGLFLPHDIVVDLALALPRALADAASLVAVTTTPRVASVVIAAGATPLAAATVAAPVVPGQSYALDPLQDGVGGWIVFGSGCTQAYSGRFSTPAQGLLAARCVRAYAEAPVRAIGKEGLATALSGVVRLLAGTDIAIGSEVVLVGGARRTVATIGLRDDLDRGVFTRYAGPCAGRPESGTCPRPAVEALNDVVPDCAGNIDLDFRGLAARPIPGGGGILVSLPIGLADACAGPPPQETVFNDRCGSLDG